MPISTNLEVNQVKYQEVGETLASWGWPVELYAGWASRTNGSTIRQPSAITVHHTGGRATATSYLVNPKDRPKLRVLANVHITADHKIKVLAAGSTSHGGYTYEPNYNKIVAGEAPLDRDLIPGSDSRTFSINTRTVGIEVDGAGGANEWDDWTKLAVLAYVVATHRVYGWSVPRVGAHKEHTRRKPGDPYMNMGTLRTQVKEVLNSGAIVTPAGIVGSTPEPAPNPSPAILPPQIKKGSKGANVVKLQKALNEALGTKLVTDGLFGGKTEAAVKRYQEANGLKVDGIVGEKTWKELLT